VKPVGISRIDWRETSGAYGKRVNPTAEFDWEWVFWRNARKGCERTRRIASGRGRPNPKLMRRKQSIENVKEKKKKTAARSVAGFLYIICLDGIFPCKMYRNRTLPKITRAAHVKSSPRPKRILRRTARWVSRVRQFRLDSSSDRSIPFRFFLSFGFFPPVASAKKNLPPWPRVPCEPLREFLRALNSRADFTTRAADSKIKTSRFDRRDETTITTSLLWLRYSRL